MNGIKYYLLRCLEMVLCKWRQEIFSLPFMEVESAEPIFLPLESRAKLVLFKVSLTFAESASDFLQNWFLITGMLYGNDCLNQ